MSRVDGTDRLCRALYQRAPRAKDYAGGSEARMLYDAANVIENLSDLVKGAMGGCPMCAIAEKLEPGSAAYLTALRNAESEIVYLRGLLKAADICAHGYVSGCCLECSRAGRFVEP